MGEVVDLMKPLIEDGKVQCKDCEEIYEKSDFGKDIDSDNFTCGCLLCDFQFQVEESENFLKVARESLKNAEEYLREVEKRVYDKEPVNEEESIEACMDADIRGMVHIDLFEDYEPLYEWLCQERICWVMD